MELRKLLILCIVSVLADKTTEGHIFQNYNHSLTAFQSWCFCNCLKGSLASLHNKSDIKSLVNTPGWIGLYRIPVIRQWVWMDGSSNEFSQGNDLVDNDINETKSCAYLNSSYQAVPEVCDKPHNTICKFQKSETANSSEVDSCLETCKKESSSHTSTSSWIETMTTFNGGTISEESTIFEGKLTEPFNIWSTTFSKLPATDVEATSIFETTVTNVADVETSSSTVDITSVQSTGRGSTTTTKTEGRTPQTKQTYSSILATTNTHTEGETTITTNKQTGNTLLATRTSQYGTETITTASKQTGLESHYTKEFPSTFQSTIAIKTSKKATMTTKNTQETSNTAAASPKTLMATTPTLVASAEEAINVLQKAEMKLFQYIGSKGPLPVGVSIKEVSLKDNNEFGETNPLANLPAAQVNNLIPKGLKANESFVAVVAEMKDESHIVSTLSNASRKSNTSYTTEDFSFKKVPILSITAVKVSGNQQLVLKAKTSFAFNLSDDDTLNVIASKQKNSYFSNLYQSTKVLRKVQYQCRYVDTVNVRLSEDGCTNQPTTTSGLVRCDCDHTTSFAVLLSISSFTLPSGVKITSFVTESISVVFLILTLILLIKLRRKLRNDRTGVQINLTVALLLFHLCNLFHDPAHQNDKSCEIITVLTHYFLLASATWMFLEGALLVQKTIGAAFDTGKHRKTRIARLVVGWGIPFIIVLVSAVAGMATGTYMQINPLYEHLAKKPSHQTNVPKYSQCWLNRDSGVLVGAVIAPVLLVIFINSVILCRMGCFVYKMSLKAENFKPTHQRANSVSSSKSGVDLIHLKASIKAVAFLIPILGLPWILGIIAGIENYETSVGFMYLNSIINGLQGVMLFLIYCVFGTEVKKALKTRWRRSRASSQAMPSEDRSFSMGKDSIARHRPSTARSDRIFGVHQATPGKFSTLPRY